MTPIDPESFGFDQARHLALRAGFGGTPVQVRALAAMGSEGAVDYLLDYDDIDFEQVQAREFDRDILHPETADEREMYRRARQMRDENALAQLRLRRQEAQRDDRRQARDLQRWWLARMIETPRPLEEKMTLFWHGHFATSYRTIENSYHMFRQNQLFRKHALGDFGELLGAIIRDPAMIAYLDNNDSRRDRPNENLARELMELFSLGVGNYSEADIKEGARALTGYTFRDDEFYFDERNHDTTRKSILGVRGNLDGEGFVRAILSRTAVSKFMAWKLYSFFALDTAYNPRERPESDDKAIDDLASAWRRYGNEIKPVLRRLFLSEHFYSAQVMGQQIKSPVELVVSSVRTLHTPPRDLGILLDAMSLMGQNLLYPPSVAGWSGGRTWINTSTLFVRQNILTYLIAGRMPYGYDSRADSEKLDTEELRQSIETAYGDSEGDGDLIDSLLRFTIGAATQDRRAALHAYLDEQGARLNAETIVGMLLLISAMPEYQLT